MNTSYSHTLAPPTSFVFTPSTALHVSCDKSEFPLPPQLTAPFVFLSSRRTYPFLMPVSESSSPSPVCNSDFFHFHSKHSLTILPFPQSIFLSTLHKLSLYLQTRFALLSLPLLYSRQSCVLPFDHSSPPLLHVLNGCL